MTYRRSSYKKNKKKHPNGFRSGSEVTCSKLLKDRKCEYEYEKTKLPYTVPKNYLPDFYLPDYDFYIEVKGRFTSEDRAKHLRVKEAHPDIDIRFVFDNPKAKLYKGSKTTYGEWCEKHGYKYCKLSEGLLKEWFKK